MDVNNQQQPLYELTKKEALLLASEYDAVLRLKIIDKLEEFTNAKPRTYLTVIDSESVAILQAFGKTNVCGFFTHLKRKKMNELITITEQDSKQIVSARELYDFLEINTDFTNWCKRMFEYGFEGGKEFTPILGKSTGGRPSIDYALTLDTAKEISMIQRSENGKQARQYFIACEKQLFTPKVRTHLEVIDSERAILIAINLYAINDFYCEVYYDMKINKILYKQVFKQGARLDKYLDKIKI
jgi:phage anti-repressor protein